jgi:hypothetical protein
VKAQLGESIDLSVQAGAGEIGRQARARPRCFLAILDHATEVIAKTMSRAFAGEENWLASSLRRCRHAGFVGVAVGYSRRDGCSTSR